MSIGRHFGAVIFVVCSSCVGDAPSLSTTAQAVISVSPSKHDFGSVAIGSSLDVSVTISPATLSGSDDDTIVSISEACSGFSVNAPGLPARVHCGTLQASATGKPGLDPTTCSPQSYTFTASFAPVVSGQQSCTVYIRHAPTAILSQETTTTISLEGTGVAATHAMQVTPSAIAFGDIPVTTSSGTQTIGIANIGSAPIQITRTAPSPTFIVGDPVSATIQPGVSISYSVHCSPLDVNLHTSSLTFTLVESGATQSVSLNCNGITSEVEVSPRPVSFPSALVGAVPLREVVTIGNSSGAEVRLDSVALDPTSSPELSIVEALDVGTALASDTNVTVTLQYSAATPRTREALGALQLVVNGQPQSVAISGEALVAAIATTPAVVDFGPICVGSPVTREVDVYASDRGRVEVTSVTPPGAIFAATDLIAQLEPLRGTEETIEVTATPMAPGEYADALVINSNIPGQPGHEVPVSAVALPAGISPTPAVVTFGVGMVGTTTIAQRVAVTNCSLEPIDIAGASIRSDAPGEFAAVSDPVATLQPGESHEILVVMTPAANGARTAELTVDIAGGAPIIVPLEGEGFGLEPIARETYYACASTRGRALWPVLLVLGLLACRRRRT